MTIREQVSEFHRAFGQPIADVPSVPSDERVRLRLKLITEEFVELLAASVDNTGDEEKNDLTRDFLEIIDGATIKVDIVALTDALADLDYVIEGTRLEFGINGEPIAAEVHRSNMAKLQDGRVIQRDDGKIQKPANWTPPDIAGVLKAQGWKP